MLPWQRLQNHSRADTGTGEPLSGVETPKGLGGVPGPCTLEGLEEAELPMVFRYDLGVGGLGSHQSGLGSASSQS